ncbi:hypothetical protein [Methanobacterium spitsbergense]|uniref:Uncharacterized protein n=1 Tax=Methanobacterium spitsbergense TaxID=2874285 RepID=A0A8T5V0R0_9EURY|nr:hypothetical protein [Methanobacterium spitsbergense]MBZ2165441.1 hypothetical protein [Methanobacterium spitsbergense]
MKIPNEQINKLESFIKQWVNPSEWYETRKNGLNSFLKLVERNNVKPDDVHFVTQKNSNGQMICEPEVKNSESNSNFEDLPKSENTDRLRRYLKQFPIFNNRIENGENVVDIAISIIQKYSEEKTKNY